MPKRFTTIKDIARALNVSVATVSRALRDTYDVSQETREKVLSMAAKLNYKPNQNAINLVRRQTHNIGVIIPNITIYYFSTVVTGIQEVATANGYNIILYITNDSPEIEQKLVRDLAFSHLDGLLACVSSKAGSCSHFQEVIDHGLPLVFFDRVADDIPASKIVQDDYNGAVAAVEHLIRQGYKSIAHITGPGDIPLTKNRLQGYIDAIYKNGLSAETFNIVHSGFSQEDGENDVAQLFRPDSKKVDAIFAVNDRKAVGAIKALQRMNIAVGRDVGVIGFTNDPISEIISPSLSTIAEPAFEVGKLSCQMLLRQVKKPNLPLEQVVLSSDLIVRDSTLRL